MKDTTTPPAGGRCHCTELRKASRRVSQLYDLALAPSGLKTTQRAILAQVRRMEPTTVRALADALVMEAGGLAHTLKPLVRDGLVDIGIDPADRRSRSIRVTALGVERLRQSDALWEAAQKGFEAGFGAHEAEALRTTLRLLTEPGFSARFEAALAGDA